MQMIINFIKGAFQLLIAIWVIEIIGKFFLRRTLIGRIILTLVKDTWLSLKLGFRIMKHLGKIAYTDTKRLNNLIYKLYKRLEDEKEQEEKVVNGNDNVIKVNFKQTNKKHNK